MPQRAAADTGSPAAQPTGDSAGQVAPAPSVETQDATTTQTGTADAAAPQAQQANSVGADRTDSSGADTVTQENAVSVLGASANDASTSQAIGPAPPTGGSSDQQAATTQDATATAAAQQPQQSNVVIIIRINSPGDDVVSQTNTVSVVAVGANQSSTSQGPSAQDAASSGDANSPPNGSDGTSPASTDSQPAPATDAAQQPAQAPDTAQPAQAQSAAPDVAQPPNPGASAELLIRTSFPSPDASSPATADGAPSPTTSALDRPGGGARRRSGASAAGTVIEPASTLSAPLARPAVHVSAGRILHAVGGRLQRWFTPSAVAPASQVVAAGPGGGVNLGLTTLAALLVGLLGWSLVTWLPQARGLLRRGVRG